MPDGSATAHLYRPELVTVLTEGYGFDAFRKDCIAALTVAVVALPLSMAIAVGSGVSPQSGLYTAIVGGFLVSALGGSRFQVGGPAGAFIVLVSATASTYGFEKLLFGVLLSGAMLTLIGVLRLGSLIRYMPHAVTVGFTCGIAVTIFASQLRDLGGLSLTGVEPGPFFPKLAALSLALPTLNPAALITGVGCCGIIFALRIWKPAQLSCDSHQSASVENCQQIAAERFHRASWFTITPRFRPQPIRREISVRVGIPRNVEPLPPPTFSILRRIQQPSHQPVIRVG